MNDVVSTLKEHLDSGDRNIELSGEYAGLEWGRATVEKVKAGPFREFMTLIARFSYKGDTSKISIHTELTNEGIFTEVTSPFSGSEKLVNTPFPIVVGNSDISEMVHAVESAVSKVE